MDLLRLAGMIFLGYYAISFVLFVVSRFFRKDQNLLEKYGVPGKKTYAVITGGSDGIGLEMCHQLARQGFNICIVSRNAAKINEKLAEIKKLYPKIETKCVAADLGKMQTMAEYYKLVADNFASMDIGYLALNAGIANGGWFALETDELLENIMILNGLHVVFLTKALLPQLEARSKRTAIVITSSIASFVGLPRAAIYSATKAMERLFGEALHYELQHKMDVMVYTPGFVKTKLLVEAQKGRNPPLTIDADVSVAGMHRDLGRSVSSCGHWKHSLLYFALMLAPGFALKKMAAGSERRKGYKQLD